MARKLSLQERESINYITDVLCHALPAAQRSFAGSLASALVRVKGDQVTDADLVRATEKFGEYQSALIEVAKAKVLDRVPAVDAKGDGEAFTLRVPESLGEAIDLFEASDFMRETLGEHIHSYLIEHKRAEWEEYQSRISQWELDRYLAVL